MMAASSGLSDALEDASLARRAVPSSIDRSAPDEILRETPTRAVGLAQLLLEIDKPALMFHGALERAVLGQRVMLPGLRFAALCRTPSRKPV